MDKIFTALRHWLTALVSVDRTPDPLAGLSVAEFADLPVMHPLRDDDDAR